MDQFSIMDESGNYVSVKLDEVYGFPNETSHWGGYDVSTSLKIKSGDFQVSSILWTSTGALYELLQQLKVYNQTLSGEIYFNSFEHNFDLFLRYDEVGHVNVCGRFEAFPELKNELHFEFISDQSFLSSTIKELEVIAAKYGDTKGVRK